MSNSLSEPKCATKERPILFSGPMVRAILEGRKNQTRRVVKGYIPEQFGVDERGLYWFDATDFEHRLNCPYGQPGDRLWVRETWGGDQLCGVAYRADHPEWKRFQGDGEQPDSAWRPSIHMPRWASRIMLEVTGVRVERLQEISEEDAKAEGSTRASYIDPKQWFEDVWVGINGFDSWEANPWVWVVEFRRTE